MRALLVLHALTALALGGATTHLAVLTAFRLFGRPMPARLTRIYSVTIAALLIATVAEGLILYPAFKVNVVAPYLLDNARWAITLFDVKEALALFALPLGVGLYLLGRKWDPDKPVQLVFSTLAISLFLIVAFCVIAGLVITAERGL